MGCGRQRSVKHVEGRIRRDESRAGISKKVSASRQPLWVAHTATINNNIMSERGEKIEKRDGTHEEAWSRLEDKPSVELSRARKERARPRLDDSHRHFLPPPPPGRAVGPLACMAGRLLQQHRRRPDGAGSVGHPSCLPREQEGGDGSTAHHPLAADGHYSPLPGMLPPLVRPPPSYILRHLPRPSSCRRLVPVILLCAVLGSLALVPGAIVDGPLGMGGIGGRWTLGLPFALPFGGATRQAAEPALADGSRPPGSKRVRPRRAREMEPARCEPPVEYIIIRQPLRQWADRLALRRPHRPPSTGRALPCHRPDRRVDEPGHVSHPLCATSSALGRQRLSTDPSHTSLDPLDPAIHLGLLTNRTVILPYFHGYASQLGDALVTTPVPNLAFGEVFDLPRLFAALRSRNERTLRGIVDVTELLEINRDAATGGRGWPALHWPTPHVVVNASDARPFGPGGWRDDAAEIWALGCWRAHRGGLAYPLERIRIVPDFTRLPLDAMPHDPRLAVQYPVWAGLVRYLGVRPDTKAVVDEALGAMNASERSALLRPNEWVACIDSIYYTTSGPTQSLWNSWSTTALATMTSATDQPLGQIPPPPQPLPPAIGLDAPGPWETVGQHVHWLPTLEEHGKALARHVLAVPDGAPPPAFIAVHIRRGDFLERCHDPRDSCFSLDAFRRAVEALRRRLLAERGSWVDAVVFATDETDPAFLAAAEALGWRRVDEETSLAVRREHGDWCAFRCSS